METLSINEFEGSLVLIHKINNVTFVHFMSGAYTGLTEFIYVASTEKTK